MQSGLHNGRKTVDVVVVLLLYYSAAVLSTYRYSWACINC